MNDTYAEDFNISEIIKGIWNASTTESNRYPDQELEWPPTPYVIFRVVLTIFGTFGNSLVVLAILLDRRLQNLTSYFLLSLAVSDLFISAIIWPIATFIYHIWFTLPTYPLCYLFIFFREYITLVSIVHVWFMNIYRYFAMKNPLSTRSLTRKRVALIIGSVWVIPSVLIIPFIYLATISELPNKLLMCNFHFKWISLMMLIVAVMLTIMIFTVLVSYTMTTIQLKKAAKERRDIQETGVSGMFRSTGKETEVCPVPSDNKKIPQLHDKDKALTVIHWVTFVFIICMAPFTFILWWPHFVSPVTHIPLWLLYVIAFLYNAHNCMNPIIYTVFNKTFREDFKYLIMFKYKKLNNF